MFSSIVTGGLKNNQFEKQGEEFKIEKQGRDSIVSLAEYT